MVSVSAAAIGSPAYTWGRSLQGSGGGLRILQRFRRPLYIPMSRACSRLS
jgi:hypothetical protein